MPRSRFTLLASHSWAATTTNPTHEQGSYFVFFSHKTFLLANISYETYFIAFLLQLIVA